MVISLKKIIIYGLTFLALFLIYRHFDTKKINYVSIGDGITRGINSYGIESYGYNDFIYDYLKKKNKLGTFNSYFYNGTITGLTKDIKDNRTIRVDYEEYYIKKILRESDVLVISVGEDELSANYQKYDMETNYIYFDKMYADIENLIKEIKLYAKGKIIFLGYYNPTNYYDSKTDEFFYDMDIRLNELMMSNDIIYLDLYEVIKSNRYKDSDKHELNIRGFKKIANLIEYYLE